MLSKAAGMCAVCLLLLRLLYTHKPKKHVGCRVAAAASRITAEAQAAQAALK